MGDKAHPGGKPPAPTAVGVSSAIIAVWSVLGLGFLPWHASMTYVKNAPGAERLPDYLIAYLVVYTLAHAGLGIASAALLYRGRAVGRSLFLWYWPGMLFVFWMLFGYDMPHLPQFALYGVLLFLLTRREVSAHVGREFSPAQLNQLAVVLALEVIFQLFALIGPAGFSRPLNLETIWRQTAIVGTAALGMTFIIIAGGIDLSVGSAVALATVAIAAPLQYWGFPASLAALCGVLICVAAGAAAGLIITSLRVLPFIVTLGMMLILRGTAKWWASEQKIDAPITWLNELIGALRPSNRWLVLPPGVWLMIVLAAAAYVLLRYTRFGRHTIAIGSNEETARLCGIPVERMKVMIFALGGGFAGMAGLMQFSRLTVGDPTVAVGTELDVIAAVVIGGGSLAGGEGSILGSLVGALLMNVIRSGCSQMDFPTYVQEIVTGAIIITAVALDRLRRRRAG